MGRPPPPELTDCQTDGPAGRLPESRRSGRKILVKVTLPLVVSDYALESSADPQL